MYSLSRIWLNSYPSFLQVLPSAIVPLPLWVSDALRNILVPRQVFAPLKKSNKRKRCIRKYKDSFWQYVHQYPIFIILKIFEIGPSNPKHKTFWMTLESLASQIPLLAWMCCAPRNCSFKTGKSTSWWIPFSLDSRSESFYDPFWIAWICLLRTSPLCFNEAPPPRGHVTPLAKLSGWMYERYMSQLSMRFEGLSQLWAETLTLALWSRRIA